MSSKEKTYSDIWRIRDENVELSGFSSFEEYRASDRYKRVIGRAKRTQSFHRCSVCRKHGARVQHQSYENLGTVHEAKDLVPLCAEHGKFMFVYAKSKNVSLKRALSVARWAHRQQEAKKPKLVKYWVHPDLRISG